MIFLFLLQETAISLRWYETPTGFAALVALIGVIAAPFINSWIQNRNSKRKEVGHLSDTSLSINREERKEAVDLMKSLHAREIAHFEKQMLEHGRRADREILESKVMEYEARQRAHMYGNECNRVVGALYRRDALLAQHEIEVPPFVYKTYPEIMAGLDELVIAFKKELEEELARRRRDEDVSEHSGEQPL
jgi:hypothetical protein